MTKTTIHQPTLEFLTAMSDSVSNDAETQELIDGIADTLGDMLGHQTDRASATSHFIDRLLAASEAVESVKSKH